jgi:predicted lipoprotein
VHGRSREAKVHEMGPTLIYDKSAIHSFSEREAYWLTNLYNVNMTPVLFMEVMTDIKKYPNATSLSAQQVQALAKKFSTIDTYQSIHHREIWANNLIGHHVPMDGRTMVGGAVPLTAADGSRGMFIDESPEERALHRWQEGAFEEFERELAHRWRESTRTLNLQQFVQTCRKSMLQKTTKIQNIERASYNIE